MGILTVALIQMRSCGDEVKNFITLEQMVRDAASQGAMYVQSPEMTGMIEKNPRKLLDGINAQEGNVFFDKCGKLAKELGIWLHIGSNAVKADNDKCYNRAAIFSPSGEQVCNYDKIHMFDVDLGAGNRWKESARYEAGNQSMVVDMDGVKLGTAICYDVRFPQIFRSQAKLGAKILTCPAAFTKPSGEAHWEILLRARAIENGAYMLAAAQGGVHEDGRETYGHSMIVDPWGTIVAELEHNEPGILVTKIDLEKVDEARAKIPALNNERKFSIVSV
ncbi:MAG: carbon-nitrogen hydrolase family protein [Rhizobiales bacterium]|nr:carbon-nitrogen hydrolase family protein [Hyphomicrobiales bacterium]